MSRKRLCLYVQVFVVFETEITRSGFSEVLVVAFLSSFSSSCLDFLVAQGVLALFGLRRAVEVVCIALTKLEVNSCAVC